MTPAHGRRAAPRRVSPRRRGGGGESPAALHARNTRRLALLDTLQHAGPQSQSLEALDDFLRGYVAQGSAQTPLYTQRGADSQGV